jgi:hypothetical protein
MKNKILENYLQVLNEGLFDHKNSYCKILEYTDYSFYRIFYLGTKDINKYNSFLGGGPGAVFPLTKPNYDSFLNYEEIIAPLFTQLVGKFSFIKLSSKIKHLNVIDSGYADSNVWGTIISISNFKNMQTFDNKNKIEIAGHDKQTLVHPATITVQLKRK